MRRAGSAWSRRPSWPPTRGSRSRSRPRLGGRSRRSAWRACLPPRWRRRRGGRRTSPRSSTGCGRTRLRERARGRSTTPESTSLTERERAKAAELSAAGGPVPAQKVRIIRGGGVGGTSQFRRFFLFAHPIYSYCAPNGGNHLQLFSTKKLGGKAALAPGGIAVTERFRCREEQDPETRVFMQLPRGRSNYESKESRIM